MTTWKGRHVELVQIDEIRAHSPLPPVQPVPEPLYVSPNGTRFFPLESPKQELFPPALSYILKDLLTSCWLCNRSYGPIGPGLHICWSNLVVCELCGGRYKAVCNGGRDWGVPDHDCRILAPFLDEARRLQCPAAPLPSSPTSGSPSSNPTCGS